MGNIDYNTLTETSKIDVIISGINKSFEIYTEASLTHGHGMPGEYGFDLSAEEKSVVRWFVEKFDIEIYKQEIEKMFEESGHELSDFKGFIKSLKHFKLWTQTAKRSSKFPDLTLSGEYKGLEYTLSFKKHQLIHAVNHYHLTRNEKNQVVEKLYYSYTNEPGWRETFKYNSKGKVIESCEYYSNGNMSTISKFNNKGVRLAYYHYDEKGELLGKRICDDNDNLVEEYAGYGGTIRHYFCSYNDDGSEKEACTYNANNTLILKEVYDQDGHTNYIFNDQDGRLERVCKFDKNNNKIDETTYNADGSVEYKLKKGNNNESVTISAQAGEKKTNPEVQPNHKEKRGRDRHFLVEIKNRKFFYDEEDGTIGGFCPDLLNLGFAKKEFHYSREVDEDEIESAYDVSDTYAVYNGCLARYCNYDKEKKEIAIWFYSDEGEISGIEPEMDYSDKYMMRLYRAIVPESEVSDIYEIRVPVEGFPFKTSRIVFLRENGIWHDERPILGALIDDNEEFLDNDFCPTITNYQQTELSNCDINQLKAKANKGNYTAQLYLGIYHQFGANVKQDYKKAFNYFKLAAEQGEPISQNCIGFYYSQGIGVEQNDREAFQWFSKSALQGFPQALWNVSRCYRLGIGVKQDTDKAVEYNNKLANLGHVVYGYRNLANIYYTQKEYVKSIIYWQLADEMHDAESTFNLGVLYFYGKGKPANDEWAFRYFKRAMQSGDRRAEFMMGYCYKEGYGVAQDFAMAEAYLQDAAEAGIKEAEAELKELKKLMKRKQGSEKSAGHKVKREYDICFEDKFIGYGD